jgi:hypothetical protein
MPYSKKASTGFILSMVGAPFTLEISLACSILHPSILFEQLRKPNEGLVAIQYALQKGEHALARKAAGLVERSCFPNGDFSDTPAVGDISLSPIIATVCLQPPADKHG